MRVTNLCKFVKTGLLINLCDFYSSILCFVMYGTIKIYAVQICVTGMLDSHNSHK